MRVNLPSIAKALPEAPISPATIRVGKPVDFVRTGVDANLHLEIEALALSSVGEIAARLGRVISAIDGAGTAIPLEVTGIFDSRGVAHLDVASRSPVEANRWYQISVSAVPGSIELQDGDDHWKLSLYTGNLVYLARVMRPSNARSQDEVFLRFTESVNFDARWATAVLLDGSGNPLPGCLNANGHCISAGHVSLRDAQITIPKERAGDLARVAPGVLHAVFGHAGQPDASSADRLPDGSLHIQFQPCEHGQGECAFL